MGSVWCCVLQLYCTKEGAICDPSFLIKRLAQLPQGAEFCDGGQHDSQEVLRLLLDMLHNDLVSAINFLLSPLRPCVISFCLLTSRDSTCACLCMMHQKMICMNRIVIAPWWGNSKKSPTPSPPDHRCDGRKMLMNEILQCNASQRCTLVHRDFSCSNQQHQEHCIEL